MGERAAGSAVEKYIWQAYKDHNVKVLGIEMSSRNKDQVISYAAQWGITFPVAISGDQASSAYGNPNNSIVLIDKKGVVRDIIASVPLADTGNAQINDMVQSVAGKIPALLATSIKQRRMAAHDAAMGATAGNNLKWTSDLKGRRLERTGTAKASQKVIDGVRRAGTLLLRR